MDKSIVSFTKIDIVQFIVNDEVKYELPTYEFLQRLKIAIENDVSKHQVIYNSDRGTYSIFHNGKKYDIYYGNQIIDSKFDKAEIIQTLDKLVELSDKQKQNQDFKGKVEVVPPRRIDDIIYDGENGIFKSEDDKVKYIKHWKKKLSENKLSECFRDIFSESYDVECSEGWSVFSILMEIASAVLFIFLAGATEIWYFALGIIPCVVDFGVLVCKDYSIFSTLGMLVCRAFKFSFKAAIFGIKKAIEKRKIKKLSKSINEAELSENISKKAPDKVVIKNKNNTLKGESKETMRKILAKLQLIKNKDVIKKYSDKLEELVEMCRNVPEKDYDKVYSGILYQLSYLDGELGEELRKQLAQNVIVNEHSRTMQLVDSISRSVQSTNRR